MMAPVRFVHDNLSLAIPSLSVRLCILNYPVEGPFTPVSAVAALPR
jgi:hypothetical protein